MQILILVRVLMSAPRKRLPLKHLILTNLPRAKLTLTRPPANSRLFRRLITGIPVGKNLPAIQRGFFMLVC